MKKIALLSFHNAANYGAALQAYALQEALNQLGYSCEYINYQNAHRRHAYSMTYHITESIKKGDFRSALLYFLGLPFMSLRKFRFRKFYANFLKCTKKIYTSSEAALEMNGKYHKFIVGSDQVWNYENNGMDFAYLLDFVSAPQDKISYSSSFGLCSIPDELINKYKKYLNDIKFISVRESYGVKIVEDLINKKAKLVLDPVFLLRKSDWNLLSHTINEKYVFSYTNRSQQFSDFLFQTNFEIGKYKHYKLARATSISDFLSKDIRVKYTMSPLEFISVINNAELIVSASFHCVSLSIILNKPFVAILSGNKGKDERLLSILHLLGLEDRILSDSMSLHKVYEPIDYKAVNSKIDLLREDSLNFLINSINCDINI